MGEPGANAQQSTTLLVTLPRAIYMGVFGTSEPDEVAGDAGEGIFIEGRGLQFQEISRGLSHVLLIGERTTRKLPSTWLGFALAGEDDGGRTLDCAIVGPNRDDTDECEFDSRHYGHVNFVWVDGHVSAVENNIDRDVYRQFALRSNPNSKH
jgi:prepilin-type processing-associated H-X9-DG protein